MTEFSPADSSPPESWSAVLGVSSDSQASSSLQISGCCFCSHSVVVFASSCHHLPDPFPHYSSQSFITTFPLLSGDFCGSVAFLISPNLHKTLVTFACLLGVPPNSYCVLGKGFVLLGWKELNHFLCRISEFWVRDCSGSLLPLPAPFHPSQPYFQTYRDSVWIAPLSFREVSPILRCDGNIGISWWVWAGSDHSFMASFISLFFHSFFYVRAVWKA